MNPLHGRSRHVVIAAHLRPGDQVLGVYYDDWQFRRYPPPTPVVQAKLDLKGRIRVDYGGVERTYQRARKLVLAGA